MDKENIKNISTLTIFSEVRSGSTAKFRMRDIDNLGRKLKTPHIGLQIDDSDWFRLDEIVDEYNRICEEDLTLLAKWNLQGMV